MSGRVTAIIADDHPLFRKGLAEVLSSDRSVDLVGEAADGEQALALIEQRQPAVAILDVAMPRLSGIDVARRARERQLRTRIILLTMHEEPEILERALEDGIAGYVLKDTAVADILSSIHYVAAGRTFVSASLSHHLVKRGRPAAAAGGALGTLTPGERRVLSLIARELTTPEIAHQLNIRAKTVENHRSNICKKLGVTGTNALVRYAIRHRSLIGGDETGG